LPDLREALADYAARLAVHPWLDTWPLAVRGVRVAEDERGAQWLVDDSLDAGLPLSAAASEQVAPLALAGPIEAFGTWDGRRLDLHLADTPLGRWHGS
jgi:hypothetical protein